MAALGFVRLAESSMTAVAYLYSGFFVRPSLALIPWILPSVLLGVPIGAQLIQRVRPETFRRVCMSFDAWVVGFGLSQTLMALGLMAQPYAYLVLAAAGSIDALLLYQFFRKQRRGEATFEFAHAAH